MTDKYDKDIENTFSDLPSDFDFFKTVYREDILPELIAREGDRREAADRSRKFTYAGFGIGAAIVLISLIFVRSPVAWIIAAVIAVGLHVFGKQELKAISEQAKLMIVDAAANGFGLVYQNKPAAPPAMREFKTLGLVPDWDRSKYEDLLTGKRGDTDFEFYEAHLEDKRTETSNGRTRTKWVTVFKGQCLVLDFHKQFHGLTKVFRDTGLFNKLVEIGQKFSNRHIEKVGLEDPVFEKAFEVFSNDQVEARYLLTPDFMQRLLDLEAAFDGKKIRCAFSGGKLFICMEGGNLFEPGSMHDPLDHPDRISDVLHDFVAVFLVIDSVSDRALNAPHSDNPAT